MLAQVSILKELCAEPTFRVLPTFPKLACSLVFKGSFLGEGLEWDLETRDTTSLFYCYVFFLKNIIIIGMKYSKK